MFDFKLQAKDSERVADAMERQARAYQDDAVDAMKHRLHEQRRIVDRDAKQDEFQKQILAHHARVMEHVEKQTELVVKQTELLGRIADAVERSGAHL